MVSVSSVPVFLGLYRLSAIDAQSIVDDMKDAFLRFQLHLAKLRDSAMTDVALWLEQRLTRRENCNEDR